MTQLLRAQLQSAKPHELRQELAKRERRVGGLMKKRKRLLGKIEALDAQIREHGPALRGAVIGLRRRPVNKMNLEDSLVKVLTGKTMSVTDVSQAVQDAGYQTTSPNFRTIVNQTLIKCKKIKRVERGQYTAK